MQTPEFPSRYNELRRMGVKLTPPALAFQGTGRQRRAVQFFYHEGERLAIHDTRPYGDRTEEALSEDAPPDLLAISDLGRDYALFDVPKDLLSITAISLGDGPRHGERLENVYERLGRVIGHNTVNYDMGRINFGNLGLLRESGRLVFLPPFKFERGNTDPEELKRSLEDSIWPSLRSVYADGRINQMLKLILQGVEHDNDR